jgi:hypothetical protein
MVLSTNTPIKTVKKGQLIFTSKNGKALKSQKLYEYNKEGNLYKI